MGFLRNLLYFWNSLFAVDSQGEIEPNIEESTTLAPDWIEVALIVAAGFFLVTLFYPALMLH